MAIVTGGSDGTGLAAARRLAEKWANVVIVARTKSKLLEGVEHIKVSKISLPSSYQVMIFDSKMLSIPLLSASFTSVPISP